MEIKLIEKNNTRWCEIRTHVKGADIQVFVSKEGGWHHKHEYTGAKPKNVKPWSQDVSEYNIRWSQNGSALMTFEDLNSILDAIEKAKTLL